MVIASDRMELYEYFGRRTEVLGQQNRNWLKFAVAVTGVHFLLVQVPQLFSLYFGDQVGSVSKKLGAQDESTFLQQLEVARAKPKDEPIKPPRGEAGSDD